MIAAYMRISTNKDVQKHDRQERAIDDYAKSNKFAIQEWYKDTISGKVKTDSRPGYQYMKSKLKAGDVLIVSDIDRLGRDASNIIVEIKDLQSMGVKIIALDIPYLNDWSNRENDKQYNMIFDIFVTLKAHMAEQEREKTVERINQGLNVAREKGVKLGRPSEGIPAGFIKKYEAFKRGEYGKLTHTEFARSAGIGRSTMYKYIREFNRQS